MRTTLFLLVLLAGPVFAGQHDFVRASQRPPRNPFSHSGDHGREWETGSGNRGSDVPRSPRISCAAASRTRVASAAEAAAACWQQDADFSANVRSVEFG